MTDAAETAAPEPEITDDVSVSPPGSASAEPPADVETEDTRTARQRILDHLEDTVDHGPQHISAIMQGTGLNRNQVDSTISRMVTAGLVERAGEKGDAQYQLAPPKPVPDPVPTPAETPRADGISLAQLVLWLHSWANGGPWEGPGKPPDRKTGIIVAGGGCLVPLPAWSTFLGERDALEKQRETDGALRARLVAVAFGNVHPRARLDDMKAIRIMLASGCGY
jgi:predicted transcriptional regulator